MEFPATVRRAVRLFFVFLTGSGLGSLVAFLALPIYTRLVNPADFGYFDLSQAYVTIVAALLYADVWVGVMRFSIANAEASERAIRVGLQFFLLSSLGLALLAGVVWALLDPKYLFLTLGLGLSRSLANFWSFASRGLGGEKAFAVSGVLNAVVAFGATVALLTLAQVGVAALFGGVIVGCLSQVAFLEARFRLLLRACRARTDRQLRTRLWRFALPLSLNSVAFWVFTGFGRIVVSQELGLEANGVFAASSKLAGIVTVVANVVTLVWQQLAFERDREDSRFFGRANALSATVYSLGCVVAVPLGVLIYRVIVDERYADGWSAVPLFLVVAALAGYSAFVGNVFYVTERTSSLLWSAAACMLVVLAASVPLVRLLGLNGANLALVLGYGVNIFVKHLLLWRFDAVSVPLMTLAFGALACAIAVVAALSLTLPWALGAAAVTACLFAGWAWHFGVGARGSREAS